MGSEQSKHTSAAITGPWTDYSTGEWSWVVTAYAGYVVAAVMGAWLSFSAKYIKALLANLALLVHLLCNEPQTTPSGNSGGLPTQETPLLEGRSSPRMTKRDRTVAKLFKANNGARDFCWELVEKRNELGPLYTFFLIIFIIIHFVFAIGLIISGIYVANIKFGAVAKLQSDVCGLWLFDQEHAPEGAATRAGIRDLEKETRASDYAQNCYRDSGAFTTSSCNYFYSPKLSFSRPEYTNDCPFEKSVCRMNRTVTFTTEMTDSSKIGINSPSAPKFRRRTSCTPLSMEYPYIQNRTENGTMSYYYYYGGRPGRSPELNYTYKTVGEPYERLAPIYDVSASAHVTSRIAEGVYWEPIQELKPPENSTLTIAFVSALRILYKKRSEDPIFPANEEVWLDKDGPWFRNSDPRARPFACINSVEVCLADGMHCWALNGPDPDDNKEDIKIPTEFWFMYASLMSTDIFDTFRKRLGRALLAQDLVSGYFSDALDDDHWVKEMENFVATAHARTQWNAWSIASGEDSVHEGKDGFFLVTPPDQYGSFCNIYKFRPEGYTNIHIITAIVVVFSLPFLLVLSSERWKLVESVIASAFINAKGYLCFIPTQLRAGRTRQNQNNNQLRETQPEQHPANTAPTTLGGAGRQDGQEETPERERAGPSHRPDSETVEEAATSSDQPPAPLQGSSTSRSRRNASTERTAESESHSQEATPSNQPPTFMPRAGSLPGIEAENSIDISPRPSGDSLGIAATSRSEPNPDDDDDQIKWEPTILYGLIWAFVRLFWAVLKPVLRCCFSSGQEESE